MASMNAWRAVQRASGVRAYAKKVPIALVKELRARTQAGLVSCKNALEAADHDVDKAIEILREEGALLASKKTGKVAAEGVCVAATNGTGSAALLELNCQSDFGARGESFQKLATRLATTVVDLTQEPTVENILTEKLAPGEDDTDELMKDVSVGEAIVAVSARLGENVQLRRVEKRTASPESGIVAAYVHGGQGNGMLDLQTKDAKFGRAAALISLQLEGENIPSAFERYCTVGGQLAQHVVGFSPSFISPDEITQEYVDEQIANAKAAAEQDKNKVDDVKGISKKNLAKKSALLLQPYAVESQSSVAGALKQHAKKSGVSATVKEFIRYETGEGVVVEDDFSAEVARMAGQ